jgi:hypothetical protein
MDNNFIILIIIGTFTIASMLAASLKKAWAKATTIILVIATLWFGFAWKSWIGALGAFIVIFLLTFILSRTFVKKAIAEANGWDKYAK